jgi:cytidyltransferase-like protein
MESYGKIISLNEFARIRAQLGRIVCTAGSFDPLNPGHASYLIESKQYGDTLVVIVNGDSFLRNRNGKAFMDLQTRCQIVSSVRNVDYVVPFEIEDDPTVSEALRRIRPNVFTRGGDLPNFADLPEWKTCQELGIQVISQVGRPKLWNSSNLLKEWNEFFIEKTDVPTWITQRASRESPFQLPPFTIESFNDLKE